MTIKKAESALKERAILEKLERSRKLRSEKKNQQEATRGWLNYGLATFVIVLALLASLYYDSGGNTGVTAPKSKNRAKSEAVPPKEGSTKKWRKIIDRALWEQQLDRNEDPDGEPADLYPKYHDLFGDSLPDLPEVFLKRLLHRVGMSYQVAQMGFEKDKNNTDTEFVGNGVASLIRYGARVLTENEEGFANALEIIKRDKVGVGNLDMSEIIFEAIESVKENIHTLQTGLLNRMDDITSTEDVDTDAADPTPDKWRSVELSSKHTSELFLVNQGVYNAIQRVLKSNEYADDDHLSYDLTTKSQKHGLSVIQTVAKYRLHRLLPVFVGLGAPTEGAIHYAVVNGDVYTTALLCQAAADTLNYSSPALFGGLTAMQLARELDYPLIYSHINQALILRDSAPDSKQYQEAKNMKKLPLGDEYASQTVVVSRDSNQAEGAGEEEEEEEEGRGEEKRITREDSYLVYWVVKQGVSREEKSILQVLKMRVGTWTWMLVLARPWALRGIYRHYTNMLTAVC